MNVLIESHKTLIETVKTLIESNKIVKENFERISKKNFYQGESNATIQNLMIGIAKKILSWYMSRNF